MPTTARPLDLPGHQILLAITPFFLTLLALAIWVPAPESFRWLNAWHGPLPDQLFTYFTFLGNGAWLVVGALFFAWRRHYGLAIIFLLCLLLGGGLCQLLKQLVHSPRPAALMPATAHPFFTRPSALTGHNSFPSGHTCTAFSAATLLFLHYARRCYYYSLFTLFIAGAVGYSRIYLGCHFLADVVAGACLGIGTAAGLYLGLLPNLRWRKLAWTRPLKPSNL